MKNKTISLSILILILISSCSSGTTLNNLVGKKGPISSKNSGVVFGKLNHSNSFGTAIKFTRIENNETYLIKGAKEFSAELPPGKYYVSSFGGKNYPSKPVGKLYGVSFTIKPNTATYIGELFLVHISNWKTCSKLGANFLSKPFIKAHKYIGYTSGFLALGSPTDLQYKKRCLYQYNNLKSNIQNTSLRLLKLKKLHKSFKSK